MNLTSHQGELRKVFWRTNGVQCAFLLWHGLRRKYRLIPSTLFSVLPSLPAVFPVWWSRCLRIVYTNYSRNKLAHEAWSRNFIWKSCWTVVICFVELIQYVWADVNQHGTVPSLHLKISVWVCTVREAQILVGPHVFQQRPKGTIYHGFLHNTLTQSLQNVQIQITARTFKNLILYIFRATDTHNQVHYQLTTPIFELQKHSYMFQLPSVAILREQQP
jgi:hypothetical protein